MITRIKRTPVWKTRLTQSGLVEFYFDGFHCEVVAELGPVSVQRPLSVPVIDTGGVEPYKFRLKDADIQPIDIR